MNARARPARAAVHASLLLCGAFGACAGPDGGVRSSPEVVATLDFVIGEGDEGDSTFGDVRGIDVDGQGRLYATDGLDGTVRVFDSTGAFLRLLGRRGEGPGEFDVPQGVDVLGSRVFVYDGDGARVAVWDTAGHLQSSQRIPVTSYGYFWEGGAVDSARVADEQLVRVDTTFHAVVRILDLTDGSADTIPLPDCGYGRVPMFRFPMGVAAVPFAGGGATWIDVGGRSIWCAHTSRAAAFRIAFGDTLPTDSLVSDAIPAAVSDSERTAAVARMEQFARDVGGGEIDVELIPSVKPVLQRVDRDPEGRIWMRLADSAGAAMDVFDSAGRILARVWLPEAPSTHHPAAFHGRHVYLVGEDRTGIPLVRRYTVDLP